MRPDSDRGRRRGLPRNLPLCMLWLRIATAVVHCLHLPRAARALMCAPPALRCTPRAENSHSYSGSSSLPAAATAALASRASASAASALSRASSRCFAIPARDNVICHGVRAHKNPHQPSDTRVAKRCPKAGWMNACYSSLHVEMGSAEVGIGRTAVLG
eukprot:COSAG06_NODE_3033_length_5938_cov_50.435006_2_plen_159_part_00